MRATIGGPGEIRTPDRVLRTDPLYPAELRSHKPAAKRTTWGNQAKQGVWLAKESQTTWFTRSHRALGDLSPAHLGNTRSQGQAA